MDKGYMTKPDFEQFYQTHFEKIYRFVFYRVGGARERAEDLTSEIFLKALSHYDRYDPAISGSAWIYTIARNHLANAFRDTKPAVSMDEVTEEGEPRDDIGIVPSDALRTVMRQAAASDLERALAILPPESLELILMRYIEGWSYRELGRKFGRSPAALRVAVYRAIRLMREKIEK